MDFVALRLDPGLHSHGSYWSLRLQRQLSGTVGSANRYERFLGRRLT